MLGKAALFHCGTPLAFHITILFMQVDLTIIIYKYWWNIVSFIICSIETRAGLIWMFMDFANSAKNFPDVTVDAIN